MLSGNTSGVIRCASGGRDTLPAAEYPSLLVGLQRLARFCLGWAKAERVYEHVASSTPQIASKSPSLSHVALLMLRLRAAKSRALGTS